MAATAARLVLLPGMDGTGRLFAPFVARLAGDISPSVVRYPVDQPLGYDQLLAFVAQAVANEPCVILAESFSGPLAIRAAATPGIREHILGLVLVATFATAPFPRWLAHMPLASTVFRVRPPRALVRSLMVGPGADPLLIEAVREATSEVKPRTLAHRVRVMADVNVRAELDETTAPVLYLRASRDRLVRSVLTPTSIRSSALGSGQPGPAWSERVIEGPHLLLQRAPSACAAEVEAFVASCVRQPNH